MCVSHRMWFNKWKLISLLLSVLVRCLPRRSTEVLNFSLESLHHPLSCRSMRCFESLLSKTPCLESPHSMTTCFEFFHSTTCHVNDALFHRFVLRPFTYVTIRCCSTYEFASDDTSLKCASTFHLCDYSMLALVKHVVEDSRLKR